VLFRSRKEIDEWVSTQPPGAARDHANNSLVEAYLKEKDFETAETCVAKSLELNPNYIGNYCFSAWLSTCSGDLEHGISWSEEALQRSPIDADSCLYSMVVANYLRHDYDRCIAALERMTAPAAELYGWAAAAYAQLGRRADAIDALNTFEERILPSLPELAEASEAAWMEYWKNIFPTRDQTCLDHLFEGLQKARLFE
jgi:tetratricopeptide (TPR) repeat protein